MFLAVADFSFVSSEVGIPFATNDGALTVTRCASASRYVGQLATLLIIHVSEIHIYMSKCMFQPTVAVSVSRQTMPVGGVSTTKCAVVLQLLALMKQTGFKLAACVYMPVVLVWP